MREAVKQQPHTSDTTVVEKVSLDGSPFRSKRQFEELHLRKQGEIRSSEERYQTWKIKSWAALSVRKTSKARGSSQICGTPDIDFGVPFCATMKRSMFGLMPSMSCPTSFSKNNRINYFEMHAKSTRRSIQQKGMVASIECPNRETDHCIGRHTNVS